MDMACAMLSCNCNMQAGKRSAQDHSEEWLGLCLRPHALTLHWHASSLFSAAKISFFLLPQREHMILPFRADDSQERPRLVGVAPTGLGSTEL